MWTKTLTTPFKGQECQVLLWFDEELDNNKCLVKIQSMYAEWFLIDEVIFSERDAAYEFIQLYTVPMAKAFLSRTYINAGIS